MRTIRDVLEIIGLSAKEIEIYLVALSTGSAPASVLARRAQITRSTAQYTCQQLVRKGLLGVAQKGNTFLYAPGHPEKLVDLVEHERRELAEKAEEVHRIIGPLTAIMNPQSVLPKVRFLEGKEGLQTAYAGVLKNLESGEEILTYVNPLEPGNDTLGLAAIIDDFIRERVRKNIRMRMIAPLSPAGLHLREQDRTSLRVTRLVSRERLPVQPVEILFYREEMCSVSAEDGSIFAYTVRHESITQMHRAMFELAWEQAGAEE